MATINVTSLSIADIEKKIAQLGAEIEKARAQELRTAEKALIAAEKSATAAKALLSKLMTKDAATPAAKARIVAAKEAYTDHVKAVAIAKKTVAILTARNKATEKFAGKVNIALVGANKGKKAKSQIKAQSKLGSTQKADKKLVGRKKALTPQPEQPVAQPKTKTNIPDAEMPMTANARNNTEETNAVAIAGLNTPEKNNSIDVPSNDELSTNIEQPANNSPV